MLLSDQARALHLHLHLPSPATGNSIPYHLPFCSTSEAAILTAHIPTKVLVGAAAATVARNQQVAEFTTVVGTEAHATAIATCATEEEAAQAAQVATRAALTTAQAAIAEADVTTSKA